MTIEPAPDGWYIEYQSRYYHLNERWLEEMYRHQVKPYGNSPTFNLLKHAFHNGADADTIAARFDDYINNKKANRSERGRDRQPETPFHEFIRRERGRNRQ